MEFSEENKIKAGFKLKFDYSDEYLYAFVYEGVDSFEVSIEYWLSILKECREKNYNKVLVVEDLEGNVSFDEAYRLSNTLTQSDFTNIVVAFVDKYIEHQELNRFSELFVSNRGLRVKVFNEVESAKTWLLSV